MFPSIITNTSKKEQLKAEAICFQLNSRSPPQVVRHWYNWWSVFGDIIKGLFLPFWKAEASQSASFFLNLTSPALFLEEPRCNGILLVFKDPNLGICFYKEKRKKLLIQGRAW